MGIIKTIGRDRVIGSLPHVGGMVMVIESEDPKKNQTNYRRPHGVWRSIGAPTTYKYANAWRNIRGFAFREYWVVPIGSKKFIEEQCPEFIPYD